VDRADVVDEHVDAPVELDRPGDQAGRPIGLGEVHGDRRDAVDPLERLDTARSGDDDRALRRELSDHGQADALARTRDDGDLVGQFEIHGRESPARPSPGSVAILRERGLQRRSADNCRSSYDGARRACLTTV
jgi:hypothetical protein